MRDVNTDTLNKHIRRLVQLRIPVLLLVLLNIGLLAIVPSMMQSNGLVEAANIDGVAEGTATVKQTPTPPVETDPAPESPPNLKDIKPQVELETVAAAVRASGTAGKLFARVASQVIPKDYRLAESPTVAFTRYTARLAKRHAERQQALPPTPAIAELLIANPANSGGLVHFRINQEIVSLQPGEERRFSGGPWSVEYHRGADFGITRQEIERGNYEFRVNSNGWRFVETH